MQTIAAYGAHAATAPLEALKIDRREPGTSDVEIDILYCGVCHSDLHTVRNEWGGAKYPVVPGHEIIGRVSRVGASVTQYKTGDMVGVGVMVDSCRNCPSCREGLEAYCEEGFTGTYNDADKISGGVTYGGYSKRIVVDQHFVLAIPENLDPAAAAPLLCAGITTWSPLRHWGAGPGKKVGVVGLGGLGHMGVKFARAMGAHVVMFTTSPSKAEDAEKLGAHEVVISSDKAQMSAHRRSFDLIIDTVSAQHDLNDYVRLLTRDGVLVMLGIPEHAPPPLSVGQLIGARRSIAGSTIGGIPETAEMLAFCGEHDIVSDVEVIAANEINTAYERMLKGDVRYRFVIDMATL
jgi:uncharacterized zinc-type alcohol dehydrogenase-like protein